MFRMKVCAYKARNARQWHSWLTLFFIDELMTGRVRSKIQSLAKVRLEDNKELLARLKDTLKEVEGLTTERNKIIHGQWIFDSTITKLHNYKLKKITTEKGGDYWQRLEAKAIFPKHLNGLTEKSEKLADDLVVLRNIIKEM